MPMSHHDLADWITQEMVDHYTRGIELLSMDRRLTPEESLELVAAKAAYDTLAEVLARLSPGPSPSP